MLTLAEEVTLLLFDEAAGTFTRASELSRNFALGPSIFVELVIADRIDADADHVFVIDAEPLENELLDPLLNRIAQSHRAHDVAHWIHDAASHGGDTFKCSLIRLVDHGILAEQERRIFGIGRSSRYDIVDRAAAGKSKKRILNVLSETDTPDLRDAVLISLTNACGILEKLLHSQRPRSTAERMYQIRKMAMSDKTISRALARIEAEMVSRLH